MTTLSVKTGETFEVMCTYQIGGVPQPLTGVTVKSQVRDLNGRLVADLAFAAGVGTGEYTLSADTTSWPAGTLFWDIMYTASGKKTLTETVTLDVVKGITQ